MRLVILSLVALLTWYILTIELVAAAPAAATPMVSVLFIGNSYTYFNNMPVIFAAIARSMPHPHIVRYDMHAFGGATLEDWYEHGKARAMLAHQHWDYVVVQEQSELEGQKLAGSGLKPGQIDPFRKYATLLYRVIAPTGAHTVLFLTWQHAHSAMLPALVQAYTSVGRELNVPVAPVGLAFAEATRKHFDLYQVDGSHPTPLASYLAACTLAATIFKEDPAGAVGKIDGWPVDITGRVLDDRPGTLHPSAIRTVTLVNLKPQTARSLQYIAWLSFRSNLQKHASLSVAKMKM